MERYLNELLKDPEGSDTAGHFVKLGYDAQNKPVKVDRKALETLRKDAAGGRFGKPVDRYTADI